jgi:hypothetical protein
MHAGMNPGFFKGTVVETEAAAFMAGKAAAAGMRNAG